MARRRPPVRNEDRAVEYIDSPLMTQRLRYKQEISARIDGNYGAYRTRLRLGARGDGHCTCPSEWWPCKHVRALAATWEANPKSFLDLEQFLSELSKRPKQILLETLARIVMAQPECLSALGVQGFAVEGEEDEDSENEW